MNTPNEYKSQLNFNGETIRVLHVVFQMDRAGLETMLMEYYRNIDRTKIQFDFLMCHEGNFDYDEEIRTLGGRIYHITPLTIKRLFKHFKELKAFFTNHKEYKVIHCHLDALSAFALCAAKKAGIPVRIAHSHNNGFEKDIKYPVRCIAKCFISRYATHFWGCSKEAITFMFGSKAEKNSLVIPNAIDFERFRFQEDERVKMRESLGLKTKLVIGHIGRFSYQKNHEFLLSVFSKLHKEFPNSMLVLVGKGKDEQKIKKIAIEKNIDSFVIFLGSRDDIPSVLSMMDVFVFPSRFEGFGIVLLEAQASGLPCIVSDIIVPEVSISDRIKRLSLDESLENWKQAILDFYKIKNRNAEFIDNNYEISVAAKKLANRYICLYLGRIYE